MHSRCCLAFAVSLLLPMANAALSEESRGCFEGAQPPTFADELAGKLERIDTRTITLRVAHDRKIVVNVEGHKRGTAAPFLGKSVIVRVLSKDGVQWAEMLAPRRP